MNVDNDVLDLLSDGQDNEALELHKERTGADHEVAAAHIQAAKQMHHTVDNHDPAVAEMDAAIHARRKIDAIKIAREAYGIGLKEAKELVEERQFALGLRTPRTGFSLFGFFKKAG